MYCRCEIQKEGMWRFYLLSIAKNSRRCRIAFRMSPFCQSSVLCYIPCWQKFIQNNDLFIPGHIYYCDTYIYILTGSSFEEKCYKFILQDEQGSYLLPAKSVLISRFPTTVINLDKELVLQSCLFGEHSSTRHRFLNVDLQCLWNDDEDAPLYPAL